MAKLTPASPDPASVPVPVSPRVLRWTKGVVAALSVLMVVLFLLSAKARLYYHFDIDDTGMLMSVKRIVDGLPLYPQPSVHFVPFLYTPLFYYASAAMTRITGVNYAALRSVSILSTLACFSLIYAIVFRETRRHFGAIVAVGIFASCYPQAKQWFDIGRVDMLYIFFLLAAIYATRWLNPVVAAALWVCAFQTKQGVLPIAFLALCHDWQRPKRVLLGLIAFFALLLGSVAVLSHSTHGWYSFYVFGLVQSLGYNLHVFTWFLSVDMLSPLGIAWLIVGVAFFYRPPTWKSRTTAFYGSAFVSMILYIWFVRAHQGAAENALLPAYVWIALMVGIAVERLSAYLRSRSAPGGLQAELILCAALFVQLFTHLYSPRQFWPLPESEGEHMALLDKLRSLPGDVMVVDHPEDAWFAGKGDYAHGEAAGTIIDAPHGQQGDLLIADFADLVHQQKLAGFALSWSAGTLLYGPHRNWMPKDFLSYYPLMVPLNLTIQPEFEIGPANLYLPCRLEAQARRLDPTVDVSACHSQPQGYVRSPTGT